MAKGRGTDHGGIQRDRRRTGQALRKRRDPVILVARRATASRELAESLGREYGVPARVIAADLADPAACESLHGQTAGEPVEILINNAGFGLRGPYTETDWEPNPASSRSTSPRWPTSPSCSPATCYARVRAHPERRLDRRIRPRTLHGDVLRQQGLRRFVLAGRCQRTAGTGVSVTVLCPGPTRTEFSPVAGIADSRLFQGSAMTAAEVAREGYAAMLAGRPKSLPAHATAG